STTPRSLTLIIVLRVVAVPRLLRFFFRLRRPPSPPLFPYTTLFRSSASGERIADLLDEEIEIRGPELPVPMRKVRGTVKFSGIRSEEHTSELQSRFDLVCRLLLEKKKKTTTNHLHLAPTT